MTRPRPRRLSELSLVRVLHRERTDGGQALAIVLALLAIIIAVPTAIVGELQGEVGLGARSVNSYAALAAAEAGIQNYRNMLDEYEDYWEYHGCESASLLTNSTEGTSCGTDKYENLPPSDESDPAFSGWYDLSGAGPSEAFTYSVDTAALENFTAGESGEEGTYAGSVQVIVTGRAGVGSATVYRTVQAGFQLSGILTDSYYSDYEQPDPTDTEAYEYTYECESRGGSAEDFTGNNGASSLTCSGNANELSSGDTGYDTETTQDVTFTPSGSTSPVTESLAQALCIYHAYQPNAYIDSLGKSVDAPTGYPDAGQSVTYSASNPFYGPWIGNFIDPSAPQYAFETACQPWNFITGETFSGTVYSNDEITTCGSPDFKGDPAIESGAPSDFALPKNWPGAAEDGDAQGYISNPGYDGSCSGTITDPGKVTLNGDQNLPGVTTSFDQWASSSTSSDGCLYTGPTMIYFQTPAGSTDTTMWVWSPLSQATGNADCGDPASVEDPGGNGTINEDFVQASVPPDGVIYVQGVPTSTSDPNYTSPSTIESFTLPTDAGMNDEFGSWTCLDPASPTDPGRTDPGDCDAGDVFVSGVVGGQVTVAATGNAYITRQLGIACALGSGGALEETDPDSGTASSSISACTSGNGDADVLGITAQGDVWLSHTLKTDGDEGYACTNPDNATASSATAWAYVVPDCDLSDDNTTAGGAGNTENPVIDAAVVSLNGQFGVQNYGQGDGSGKGVYLYGSDVGYYRGTFGLFDTDNGQITGVVAGYEKELSYDERLLWLSPPHFVQATDAVWDMVQFDDCGSSGSAAPPTGCA